MKGCEGYDAIASVYDRLNAELDYGAWADFLEEAFRRFLPERPELLLDLACGTGRMTRELASRGYDMIGVDGSDSMLSEAYAAEYGDIEDIEAGEGEGKEKEEEARPSRILYLLQDMRELELYGTVGAAVCCLDSLNYLLTEEDLRRVLSLVHNYLDPDGVFLFDMNTPYKFEQIYGSNAYVLEDERLTEEGDRRAVYCGWQNQYDPKTGICDFYLSLFEEGEDGSYRRSDEHQQERCYTESTVRELLTLCGFELLGIWSDYDFTEAGPTAERWYIAARAKKENASDNQK